MGARFLHNWRNCCWLLGMHIIGMSSKALLRNINIQENDLSVHPSSTVSQMKFASISAQSLSQAASKMHQVDPQRAHLPAEASPF